MPGAALAALAMLGTVAIVPGAAAAGMDHSRPLRIVVPFGPGGATDILARAIGQKLSEAWSQTVVVDNRPGAGGIIGSDLVAKATPDGHTLLLATAANAANPAMEPKMPHDLLRDFAPVTQLVNVPFVLLVNPKTGITSVPDLIARAKAQPGKLSFATVGVGSSNHLMMELLKSMSETDILHVPYKGVGPATLDLLAGRVDMMLASVGVAQPHLKEGKLRPVGVTSAKRSEALPDVPSFGEALKGYDMTPWYGVLAPARTPDAVIKQLNTEIVRILGMPDIQASFRKQGFEPVGSSPEAFGAFMAAAVAKFAHVVKVANIKKDR